MPREVALTKIRHKIDETVRSYENFSQIDGRHPLQERVPFAYVSYQARRRKGGKVSFFNFPLAKEMGLIAPDHPHEMNDALNEKLLDTFALIIVNEYDLMHPRRVAKDEVKEHHYMATRYLQLQHADRRGLSSGDGRSIWNGCWNSGGRSWDISSCGTGATCLSPATSQQKTFFRSGDPNVSYGCGYSKLQEGLIDVLFSEILHRNNLKTERVLCVVEFPKNFAVTVRAGENLLRPSHFFLHLKQSRLDRLKPMVDYHIERQIQNQSWKTQPGVSPYRLFMKNMVQNFAHAAAQFEAEYIFCWMEWDGDNILADAGIIDYGSIRQFGLFFHGYRFDDHERWSTNLKQQRAKARYMIQTFAQMIAFLQTGRKKPIEKFARAPELAEFDRVFERSRQSFFLRRLGLTHDQAQLALQRYGRLVVNMMKAFSVLEHAKSSDSFHKVPDGENWHMLFSMRKLLRQLPELMLQSKPPLSGDKLLTLMASQVAKRDPLLASTRYQKLAELVQKQYSQLVDKVLESTDSNRETALQEIFKRAALINREDRVTGDAVCILAEQLTRQRRQLSSKQFHKLIEEIIRGQVLNPDFVPSAYIDTKRMEGVLEPLVRHAIKVVHSYREGL